MTRDQLEALTKKHNEERSLALEEAVQSSLPLSETLVKRLADLDLRNKYIVQLDNYLYARELVDNALQPVTTTKIPYDA